MIDKLKQNKKILIVIGIIIIQLVAIGSYGYTKFVYPEIQLDEKYDNAYSNMVTHSSDAINSIRKTGGDVTTAEGVEKILSLTNSSIDNAEKAVYYSNEMVNYANSDEEKEFAEITLKINTHYLAYYNARYNNDMQWKNGGMGNNDLSILREQLLDELAEMFTDANVFLNENNDFNNRMNSIAETDTFIKSRIWTV